ncbi:MAG TPA: hypothetical protein VHN74_01895 [Candidatus Angelobacter sp.]|jgi:hypothetical protein|nr:hypothetical protein [Candidatus Angelobacter sp.]
MVRTLLRDEELLEPLFAPCERELLLERLLADRVLAARDLFPLLRLEDDRLRELAGFVDELRDAELRFDAVLRERPPEAELRLEEDEVDDLRVLRCDPARFPAARFPDPARLLDRARFPVPARFEDLLRLDDAPLLLLLFDLVVAMNCSPPFLFAMFERAHRDAKSRLLVRVGLPATNSTIFSAQIPAAVDCREELFWFSDSGGYARFRRLRRSVATDFMS